MRNAKYAGSYCRQHLLLPGSFDAKYGYENRINACAFSLRESAAGNDISIIGRAAPVAKEKAPRAGLSARANRNKAH